MKLGIIGAGKVGTALGNLLQTKGHLVIGVASRTMLSAQKCAQQLQTMALDPMEVVRRAEVVLITTSDQAIAPVVNQLAKMSGFRSEQVVIHTSGSLTSEVLTPAAHQGAGIAAMHPLQACADVEQAVARLPGSVFSIEGDERGIAVAKQMVAELGASWFMIDKEAKPLYHAAACTVSNYLVTLVDMARQMLLQAGMPADMFGQAFFPLLEGTMANLQRLGAPQALTGPIARGDVATISQHLQVMAMEAPSLLEAYITLGRETVKVALAKGTIDEAAAARFGLAFTNALLGLHAGSEKEECWFGNPERHH